MISTQEEADTSVVTDSLRGAGRGESPASKNRSNGIAELADKKANNQSRSKEREHGKPHTAFPQQSVSLVL